MPIIALNQSLNEPLTHCTSRIRFVQPVTPAGIILPHALSIRVDPPRVAKVLIRIIKGLYLHETGHRLASTHHVLPCDELAVLHCLPNVNPPLSQDYSLFPALISRNRKHTAKNNWKHLHLSLRYEYCLRS